MLDALRSYLFSRSFLRLSFALTLLAALAFVPNSNDHNPRNNNTMSTTTPKLFTPIQVGRAALTHRVVLAPLTRYRANRAHVHGALAVEYYAQRARKPGGTLLITEGTFIAPRAGGYDNVPGLWNEQQIDAWKKVTDAVHAEGSYIFVQLWALGRAADPAVLKADNLPFTAPSAVQLTGEPTIPRALTTKEVKEYVQLYATAAANAVRAGFDGVELHNANGYLPDQFLQDVTNKRTDEYGGSVENRARFTLEVIDEIVKAIGEDRTAIRLSPWGRFNDMRMDDLKPTFSYLVRQLAQRHSGLAYLHLVEPRVEGSRDRIMSEGESNDFLREIWSPRPFISAGGYTRETAIDTAENKGDIIAFGRAFISNPDLPYRLKKNIPLTLSDRSTYYTKENPVGYIDYPFADESSKEEPARATL